MSAYKIRDGFTVRLDELTLLTSDDVVELDDDTAALHAHKLEPADPAKAAEAEAAAKAAEAEAAAKAAEAEAKSKSK